MSENILNAFVTIKDFFLDIQDLFTVGTDIKKTLLKLSKIIKNTINFKKICIIDFNTDSNSGVLCLKDQTCTRCVSNKKKIKFARDVTALMDKNGKPYLLGNEFTEKLTAGQRQMLKLENPVFFQIKKENTPQGVLCCDREVGESWTGEEIIFLEILCNMIALTFHNISYYNQKLDQEAILEKILDNLDTCIYVSKLDTSEILFINKKMKEIFGLKGDATGQICWKVLQSDMTEPCSFCPKKALLASGQKYYTWEEHNTITNRIYKNTDSIIGWLDGSLVHLQHSVDITEIKNAENDLRAAMENAEKASGAKSDFLSRMSHEIRTPMNAITGMTHIAMASSDMAKIKQCLEKIDLSSKNLLAIINDILDVSKIEANKLILSNEEFNFETMMIELTNIISIKSEERNQSLQIEIDSKMPRKFIGDELRLSQVITNLLTNAIKFTPEKGIIKLTTKLISRHNNNCVIEVKVKDTGIGILEEQQKKLFTSFEQAEGGIARKYGGTGLGLAICKSIVTMMNGNIWVNSKLGQGSTFTFTVCLKAVETEPDIKLSESINLKNLNVLIVDDFSEDREYFLDIMKMCNIQAGAAEGCEQAIDMIEESIRQKKPYNVLFVDMYMPEKDGIQTIQSIKHKFKHKMSIFMISASEWREIAPKAKKEGVEKFISKPLFPSAVINGINEVMGVSKKKEIKINKSHHAMTADVFMEKFLINENKNNIKKGDEKTMGTTNESVFDVQSLIPYINVKEGLERLRGKEKLYVKLLQSFVSNTRIDELKSQIDQDDLKNAAATAHTIKGVAANLSLTDLYENALLIEMQLKDGFKAGQQLEVLEKSAKKTLELIDSYLEYVQSAEEKA